MIVAVFTQVILWKVVKMGKKQQEQQKNPSVISCLSLNWAFVDHERKGWELTLLSFNHNQIALLCLESETCKTISCSFLQCLTLQPQCKHTPSLVCLALSSCGLAKKEKRKERKEKPKSKKKKERKSPLFHLSIFTHWDVSTCAPTLLFFLPLPSTNQPLIHAGDFNVNSYLISFII